ncbi:uncharacterized protein DUF2812 [Serpentinicella alkaliphila]|uniref:Uncharacterized protein DUF2812 n=1 Tax=Serpentinicella alkaliphila TaxID=1734049 RepID=A0A4R2U2S6_9FIRM|nr:uncharacterized protein DUF2812 [Serpentinicella alkaliphila]
MWQDDLEEKWLRNMSLSGWHLVGISSLIKYHFVKGDPENYNYKLDFVYVSDTEDYIDIFENAGWEYIDKMFIWRYFRKHAKASETEEIYTDNQSKIDRNKSIIKMLYGALLINIVPSSVFIFNYLFKHDGIQNVTILNVLASIVLGYAIYKIKNKMKY